MSASVKGPFTPEMVAQMVSCGPDPERHLAAIDCFVQAGFDQQSLYVCHVTSQCSSRLHKSSRKSAAGAPFTAR